MTEEAICKWFEGDDWQYESGWEKVQPLTRCKDCKWYKTNYSWDGKEHRVCVIEPYEPVRKADDFCSRAERKEE